MDQVPEYSYRSPDASYEVFLPSWAMRMPSIDLVLTNPDEPDDIVRVRAQDLEDRATIEVLEAVAREQQSFLDEQSTTVWTGAIDGRDAVRRTATGSFSWAGKKDEFLHDCIVVGVENDDGRHVAGSISAVARAGSPIAARDILDVINPRFDPAADVSDEMVSYGLRGFGVQAAATWSATVEGLSGRLDIGPLVPSTWGGEQTASGYVIDWAISGLIPELTANVRQEKERLGSRAAGHGLLDSAPAGVDHLRVEDDLLLEVPAAELPKLQFSAEDGSEVLMDHPDSRAGHRLMVLWLGLGVRGGCQLRLKVEEEARPRWDESWSGLVSAIKLEEGSRGDS